MTEDDKYIIWLSRIKGIGDIKINKLIEHFGSAKCVWKCQKTSFKGIRWLSEKDIYNIMTSRNTATVNRYVEELETKNIQFISINNKKYPYLLKQIFDPPIGLYVLGEIPDDSLIKVSVVGSRKCTEYGKINTCKFCKEFVENDIVVVSGMAYGIDCIANRTAVESGGKTIAVLGNGVDICYPTSNRDLMSKIIENGCVISEFPPKTPPYKFNFPKRNRIISGLSSATVIIEAGEKSGALITAHQALEQGRDVFAMPGNITSKMSVGTNNLIKEGAYVLTKTDDLLDVLKIEKKNSDKTNNKNILNSLAPEEKLVYDCIDLTPITVDELVLKTDSQVQTIRYILAILEIKGYVQKLPGQKYIRSF